MSNTRHNIAVDCTNHESSYETTIYCFLHVQGLLLPDLVEFYQWLHTALAHIVTYEQATTLPIGRVVNLAAKHYPRKMGDHLVALYERLKGWHFL